MPGALQPVTWRRIPLARKMALASGVLLPVGIVFGMMWPAATLVVMTALMLLSVVATQTDLTWRGWTPPDGVTHRRTDPTFVRPEPDRFDTAGTSFRNIVRGSLDGRDWVAWQERHGLDWQWRCAVPLHHPVGDHVVEFLQGADNRSTFGPITFPESYNVSPEVPPRVRAVLSASQSLLEFRTHDRWVIAREPGMTPGDLESWMEHPLVELVAVAEAYDDSAPALPDADADAPKALTTGGPGRNVWTAPEVDPDPVPEPAPSPWEQPDFDARAPKPLQDPRP